MISEEINFEIHPVGEVEKVIKRYLLETSNISKVTSILSDFIKRLRDDLYVVIEYSYVDKLYRDSYYYYFSSKRKKYNRNTIRIAFFNCPINENDFRESSKIKKLQEKYLGFLVIRPIWQCIGRNVISPMAFKNRNFFIRTTQVKTAINGIKLIVKGFPHSSQNLEAITCAETTVWALMEYFGTRYPDYSVTLPSHIRELLKNISPERLLPSDGLFIKDISYLITKLGFGSRIYEKETYNSDNEFKELLNCYIESGMPVVLGLNSEDIGHVVLCIGRKYIPLEELSKTSFVKIKDAEICDFHTAPRDLIVIDDNSSPYQVSNTEFPTSYYIDEVWHKCEISHFIVPLHKKIYLEAAQARSCLFNFFESGIKPLPSTERNYIRLFLTTGRSLKHNLIKNRKVDKDFKDYIGITYLPKFVWVCELSTLDLIDQKLANGLVVIDATEADIQDMNPIIFAAYNNKILRPGHKDIWNYKESPLSLQPFFMYNYNLKLYR